MRYFTWIPVLVHIQSDYRNAKMPSQTIVLKTRTFVLDIQTTKEPDPIFGLPVRGNTIVTFSDAVQNGSLISSFIHSVAISPSSPAKLFVAFRERHSCRTFLVNKDLTGHGAEYFADRIFCWYKTYGVQAQIIPLVNDDITAYVKWLKRNCPTRYTDQNAEYCIEV